MLADILRTDRHLHRPLSAISEHARAVKALARRHQGAIWALHQSISRLRSVLLAFYPQALQAFPNLKHKAAITVLAALPTPAAAAKQTRRRVVTLLQRSGRGNHSAPVEQILADLRAPALRQPPRVETALGTTVTGLVAIVASMQDAVESLERELARELDTHPHAVILPSAPGRGRGRSSPPVFSPKWATTPHDSATQTSCARSRAPHRRRSRPGARTTSRPARSATKRMPVGSGGSVWTWAFSTL